MVTATIPVTKVTARRIALVSDTHFMDPSGGDVPVGLLQALQGVDLILHLGHISSPGALDRMAVAAPVLAVGTDLDERLFGERQAAERASGRTAARARVLEAGGVRIGAIHDLHGDGIEVPQEGDRRPRFLDAPLDEILTAKFGARVDVVAFASTHVDMAFTYEGVTFVNPGSPNLPAGPREGGPGTIALLTVEGGSARVEVIEVGAVVPVGSP